MDEAVKNDQVRTCPQYGAHCPMDALQYGRGRRYLGVAEAGHEHGCGHGHHGHGGHGK